MNPPEDTTKRERWIFASGNRNHGKIEKQVRNMATRIVEHGLSHVTIEVTSDETYRLREENKKLRRELNELKNG